jgi:hypothetical protein
MTREEAYQKVNEKALSPVLSASIVDALEALGLLKFDSPTEETALAMALQRSPGMLSNF